MTSYASAFLQPADAVLAHQPSHTLATRALTLRPQLGAHARTAVVPTAPLMDGAHLRLEPLVVALPPRCRPTRPRVVAAAGTRDRAAKVTHSVARLLRMNDLEVAHGVSFAKKAQAVAKISFSRLSCAFSRR